MIIQIMGLTNDSLIDTVFAKFPEKKEVAEQGDEIFVNWNCLLYTSPSPRDRQKSRMPSSA